MFLVNAVAAADATPSSLPVQVANDNTLMGHAENTVASWVVQLGPWGPAAVAGVILLAGIGLPVSEEVLVIPTGFLVAKGLFPLWWAVLLIWGAVVLADLIWLLLVRRWSHQLLKRRFFRRMAHPRRLLEMKHLLDRWGAAVIVAGRLMPGMRTPTVTAAGLAHMPLGQFLVGECIGAAKSVGWQLGAGWLLAQGVTTHHRPVESALLIAAGIAVVVVAVWWHRRNRGKRRPRARMQWLRGAARGTLHA